MIKEYKGYKYIVYLHEISGGMRFYCAYIKLPATHPLCPLVEKQRWFSLGGRRHYHRDYEALDKHIDVHGGFTFAEKIQTENKERWPQRFDKGLWIGWDYGHAGDDTGRSRGLGTWREKKWTEGEVELEAQIAIEQLINYEKDNEKNK